MRSKAKRAWKNCPNLCNQNFACANTALLVFPMSSIEYPGTRVIRTFCDYSTTRVIRPSIEYLQFSQKMNILKHFGPFKIAFSYHMMKN